MMKHPTILWMQPQLKIKQMLTESSWLSINSSIPTLPHPSPSSRNPTHSIGSDPKKLHTFIFQFKLNFRDCKDLFNTKENKVNYALSHLKGITLDCFEPVLLGLHNPVWLSDFNLFIMELENNFVSFDPKGKAEAELEALLMHENHQ